MNEFIGVHTIFVTNVDDHQHVTAPAAPDLAASGDMSPPFLAASPLSAQPGHGGFAKKKWRKPFIQDFGILRNDGGWMTLATPLACMWLESTYCKHGWNPFKTSQWWRQVSAGSEKALKGLEKQWLASGLTGSSVKHVQVCKNVHSSKLTWTWTIHKFHITSLAKPWLFHVYVSGRENQWEPRMNLYLKGRSGIAEIFEANIKSWLVTASINLLVA